MTVNVGGTLGGTGNASGGAVVLGTITAGPDAVNTGTLTTGAENWNTSGGSGIYLAKVSADTKTSDRLLMSGLTLTASPSAPFLINVTSTSTATLASTASYVLATDTDPSASNPFNSSTFAANTLPNLSLSVGGLQVPAGYQFQLDTKADGTGYDLLLDVTAAAPEPTSLLLAATATAPLALGRRRRRRAALSVA